ncbi:MAG: hypothetical protein ACLTMP_03970 [Eggerthella lenta]
MFTWFRLVKPRENTKDVGIGYVVFAAYAVVAANHIRISQHLHHAMQHIAIIALVQGDVKAPKPTAWRTHHDGVASVADHGPHADASLVTPT